MSNKNKIAVSIIGFNEAEYLKKCLESVSWADQIIYIDCESNDNSIEVAKKYTDKVFCKPNNKNLNINKSFGFAQCTVPWILYLDPDEILPEETAVWIKKELQDPKAEAYYFRRKNHYLGRWLKHGGQYPDLQLRLFKKEKAFFPCKHVHEKLIIAGRKKKTNLHILHYPFSSIEVVLHKFDFYTSFEAEYLLENQPKFPAALMYIVIKPCKRFFIRYILKAGFLDGYQGFIAIFFAMINYLIVEK